MGGNAFNTTTARLPASAYFALTRDVMAKLAAALPGRKMALVPAYAGKPDFGDADVLIQGGEGYDPVKLATALEATEIVRNGDVTSLGYTIRPEVPYREGNTFQVDLIKVPAESFEFALRYLALNDMGNLLGRVAHKAGVKLGHLGLLYVLRDPDNSDHVIAELTITRDWDEALRLLGYDPVRYQAGFEGGFASLTDIFDYVVSSPYCNKDIYLLENRNNKARVRDRKRKTYQAFLAWLETVSVNALPCYDWADKETVRQQFLGEALARFPAFKEAYLQALADWRAEQAFRAKFNGKLVAEITGLKDKALGSVMQRIQEGFSDKAAMRDWVREATPDIVRERIRQVAAGKTAQLA